MQMFSGDLLLIHVHYSHRNKKRAAKLKKKVRLPIQKKLTNYCISKVKVLSVVSIIFRLLIPS